MRARSGGWRRLLRPAMALALSAATPVHATKAAEPIVVFAAASLKNALDDVARTWSGQTGNQARISYAGTARLARQIEQGAPADLFIAANVLWMDWLEARDLIAPATRTNLLGNRLVLIAHGTDAPPVRIVPGFGLAALLGDGRLAMALVDAVPAGIYGKAALTALGEWPSVSDRVAQTDNVRAALALVARGEARFGIVYATDASVTDTVTVVGTFPDGTYPPIVYPAALSVGSRSSETARSFLEFLRGEPARRLFENHGFKVLADARTE